MSGGLRGIYGAIYLCCEVPAGIRPKASVKRDIAGQPSSTTRLDITMPATYSIYFLTHAEAVEMHP